MRLQIRYADRTRETAPHRCIARVGGLFSTGKPWKVSVAEAIANIESGLHEFYIVAGQSRVEIVVGSYRGNKYLKAKDDTDLPDRLLALGPLPK